MELGEGRGGGTRQRDGLWGTEVLLMSWAVVLANGGVGLSDPIQHAQKKSRPKPLRRTRVAMATPLPSGTRSAGNQLTECVCSVYAGTEKMLCHHYCLKPTGLTVTSTRGFLFSFWATYEYNTFSLLYQLSSQVFPRVLVHVLRVFKCVYKGRYSIVPICLHMWIILHHLGQN